MGYYRSPNRICSAQREYTLTSSGQHHFHKTSLRLMREPQNEVFQFIVPGSFFCKEPRPRGYVDTIFCDPRKSSSFRKIHLHPSQNKVKIRIITAHLKPHDKPPKTNDKSFDTTANHKMLCVHQLVTTTSSLVIATSP